MANSQDTGTTICPSCKDMIITADGKWTFCIDCPHFDVSRIVVGDGDQSRDAQRIPATFSMAGKVIVSSLTDIIVDQRIEIDALTKDVAESYFRKVD